MLEKLKRHWKVSGTQLLLILCVFAITGTLTAYISKQITSWLEVEKYSALFWALKIGVLIFGYQVIILLVSIPFGQFPFFWNYEKKILRRMGLIKKEQAVSPLAEEKV
jgi:TctA family transporter